jgi:rRNA pseudouridine-1189 N-methylase Emg1 (Nep1/Mra1 family)
VELANNENYNVCSVLTIRLSVLTFEIVWKCLLNPDYPPLNKQVKIRLFFQQNKWKCIIQNL